jgi:hypothetical protein
MSNDDKIERNRQDMLRKVDQLRADADLNHEARRRSTPFPRPSRRNCRAGVADGYHGSFFDASPLFVVLRSRRLPDFVA